MENQDHCRAIVQIIKDNLPEILNKRNSFQKKPDDSFVSQGDLLVQDLVFAYLRSHLPNYQLISEELAPFEERSWDPAGSYVVLDPIDGTENFISGLKEWGVGLSIYKDGVHIQSCIYLPELDDVHFTGALLRRYKSRIYGLSSSLNKDNLASLPEGYEYRIIGCSMYNMLSAVRGAFAVFENVKGVNCWDVLPGLNLALEQGCRVEVDGKLYDGTMLFPTKKYKIRIENIDSL